MDLSAKSHQVYKSINLYLTLKVQFFLYDNNFIYKPLYVQEVLTHFI